MRHKEIFSLVLFSLIITAFPHPGLCLTNPGKPGAYFWGDVNGNGIVDSNDITVIQNAYAGDAYTIQDVIPDSGYTQELNGNGLWADSGDITQLMNYFQGEFSTKPGHPDVVILEGATHLFLIEGESVEISAYALDNAGDSDGKADKRAGWGIVFRVNTAPASGRCTDVYIQGRDVLPQTGDGDSILWFPHVSRGNTAEAFAYTLDANTIEQGIATVKIMAGPGCLPGDSIEVSFFIPSDAEAHIGQSRNPITIGPDTIRGIIFGCIDNDGDGYGDYCTLGPDCDDSDVNNWTSCAACLDSDTDSYFSGCDAYVTISGPDCDDTDPNNWVSCATCSDFDGDGYRGTNCDLLEDQCDTDNNNWTASGCANCYDADGDLYRGTDCDLPEDYCDSDSYNWNPLGCANCTDADGDGYRGTMCDSKEDYCDDDPYNWTANGCASCQDLDGDGHGTKWCDIPSDSCDDDPYNWTPAGCANCFDADGDTYRGTSCDLAEDLCDGDQYNWTESGCADCSDEDGDGWRGTQCDISLDCDDSDVNNWSSCATCMDSDTDTYFSGCDAYVTISGPDCDDSDANNWVSCVTCVDGDGDSWYLNCDAYVTISGPDCDDTSPAHWQDCGSCVDTDADGYGVDGSLCDLHPENDCDDADLNNWLSCATCADSDGDTFFAGCDAYITISGPDCDDADVNNWVSCAACLDSDTDTWYVGCDAYITISGPDCDDDDPNNWTSCATCTDGDGDSWYLNCDAYVTISGPDCDDADGYNWVSCATCTDADGDTYKGTDCDLSEDCDDTDPNNWTSCATCLDSDTDTYFSGCDAYVTIPGPDCDDADANNWTSCATCGDGDGDSWYLNCDAYVTISGPDCDDADGYNWVSCATCTDADGDTYRGTDCDISEDCDDTDPNNWISCATCTDLDGDAYRGTDCDISEDCDDSDANNWVSCMTCLDADTDTWYVGCDAYVTISGPDCDDTHPAHWQDCAVCVDSDADGYGVDGSVCDLHSENDCDDADLNNWLSCATCADSDLDTWYAGCDAYITISGVDCDDSVPDTYPGAPEICDSIDNQCPGDTGYGYVDEGCATAPPVIGQVFPFDFDSRFWGNAHTDQGISIYLISGQLDLGGTSVVCTPSSGPAVNFTCDDVFPVDNCSPAAALQELMDYTCDIIVSNALGSDTISGLDMITATSQAPASPAAGGMGGGYIGGNSATWTGFPGTAVVDAGTVNIQLIDLETLLEVGTTCYVQIMQGGTVMESYYQPGAGGLSLSLNPSPVDEITFGCKCGLGNCGYSAAESYHNYRYLTIHDVDAKDMVVRMELMEYAKGYENEINPQRSGRYRVTFRGTVPESSLQSFIWPRPSSIRMGQTFLPPVHLRAAFAMMAPRNVYDLNLDTLLSTSDEEISISFCTGWEWSPPAPFFTFPVYFPKNLVVPELVRQDWTDPCASYTANPGIYNYEVSHWVPNDTASLLILGAYINASNILAEGIFPEYQLVDFFTSPIYLCGLGTALVTSPDLPATGDQVVNIGNTPLEYDLRETWFKPDKQSPGYDPDTGVQKKVVVNVGQVLPIDPARKNAFSSTAFAQQQGDFWGWSNAPFKDPNQSDSKLGISGDTTNWDARFYRRHVLTMTGLVSGHDSGIGIFGFHLNPKIDDSEFTLFRVGYLRSESRMMGSEDQRPWAASTSNSNHVSRELTAINSQAVGDTDDAFDFTPMERTGPAYYAALITLMRGSWNENMDPIPPSPHYPSGQTLVHDKETGLYINPGRVVAVRHTGPVDSATYFEGDSNRNIFISDFLNMPEALSPTPDEYVYPAPQWSNTLGNDPAPGETDPRNRNAELQRVLTASLRTGATIQIDPADGRRYFEFTIPTFMRNKQKRPDSWSVSFNTVDLFEPSAQERVHDTDGIAGTPAGGDADRLYDDDARFITQGVSAGDDIHLNKGRTNAWRDVAAVISETELQLSYSVPAGFEGLNYIEYWIHRSSPAGGCVFDEWYGIPRRPGTWIDSYGGGGGGGGGPVDPCKPVTIWSITGPVPETGSTMRVHIPEVISGSRVIDGVAGYVPDPYEGHLAEISEDQLEWTINLMAFSTIDAAKGGLGGTWDGNNQNFWRSEYAISDYSSDSNYFIWQ